MSQDRSQRKLTRRTFLGSLVAGLFAGGAAGVERDKGWGSASAGRDERRIRDRGLEETGMEKTVLSFYVDDTSPYGVPPGTFKRFLDFVSAEGIRGESSVILGMGAESDGPLSRPTTDLQRAYIEELHRAFDCGIDSQMELMTHGGLYDFETHRAPEGAIHEGLWLHEPGNSVEIYEAYLGSIIAEGERIGVRFTGMTWPGCSCEACERRYAELRAAGSPDVNPNVWQALLNLAKRGKFRGRTVPCFADDGSGRHRTALMAGDGEYGVYDLVPNAGDNFGIWENNPDRVDADYYITEDGESGRIVELVRDGAPYCLFYAHWQGLNPARGVGWNAFTQVIRRIQRYLGEQVVWMRPSEYTDALHGRQG